MRYSYAITIALVFVYVDACAVKPGFVSTYGSSFSKKYLGTVGKNGQEIKKSCSCVEKYGADFQVNENDVTNPDNLVRPCSMGDYECMRSFLAKNSKCKPSRNPVADPLHLEQLTLIVPISNMSLTGTNVTVEGLAQSQVTDFYYNNVTGNVVINIAVPTLIESSPKIFYSYLRKGKETIVLADAGRVEFCDLSFTSIIPKMPNLCMAEADIHADGPIGKFSVGPKAYTSNDPEVKASFNVFKSNLQVVQKASLVYKAQLFVALYIQNFLCDFGMKLYNV